jgi:2-keto-4-pentenoate hydratase
MTDRQPLTDRILQLRPGLDRLDDVEPSPDVDAGLAVSAEVIRHRLASGSTIAGWKVGFSAGASRAMFPDGFRPFGVTWSDRLYRSGASIDLGQFVDCRIENEIALVLDAPLSGPDVTIDGARAAVGAVAAAFEICEVRAPLNVPLLAADNMTNWGIVVGDTRPASGFDAMPTMATIWENGEERGRGAADGYLDDPFESLYRLCAALDRHGFGLEPGHVVVTGAFAACEARQPATWRAEFSGIGAVEVHLAR